MLSHHESHVLALIRKWQPTTAYFVRKALQRSLASSLSDSPGSVYPVVERLKRAGLVSSEASENDGRKTDYISCTEAGEEAIKAWLLDERSHDLLPEDPWRTRMIFADLLTPAQQQGWLAALRQRVAVQLREIDDQAALIEDKNYAAALENARLVTEARMVWIERCLANSIV